MKKIFFCLFTVLLFSANARAQFGGLESLRELICQKYARFGWSHFEFGGESRYPNFFTFTAPRDSVSAEDIYTLRSVFNAAMASADEANLYESHRSRNCDTISYSVVFGGNLLPDATSNKNNFEMSGHYFTLGNQCSGILDITCDKVKASISYFSRDVNNMGTKPTDNSRIEQYLKNLSKDKSAKVNKVSYQKRRGGRAIICLNMDDNSVTHGRRIDVSDNVDRVYRELSQIMRDYVPSGQRVRLENYYGEQGLVLNNDQYLYRISKGKDGILHILALEHTGKGLFLPEGWQNFVEYNEGKTK